MVSLLFALSLFLSPAHHASLQPVTHAVQDYAPTTVNTPDVTLPDPDAVQAADAIPTSDAAPAPAPIAAADEIPTIVQPDTVRITAAPSSDLTAEEAGLLALINSDRASEGLGPVEVDSSLTDIARAHSQDMCRRHYFDHIAPGPGAASPMDRYLAMLGHRPSYAMVGENIYYRSVTDSPDQSQAQAETAFMNSPGHRANIMQPRFTKVGVGFYRAENGQYWVTEMFLRDSQ